MSDPLLYLTLDLVRWQNRVLGKDQVDPKKLCLSMALSAIRLCKASGVPLDELSSTLGEELASKGYPKSKEGSSEDLQMVDRAADAVDSELADVGLGLISLCSRSNISLKSLLQERLLILKQAN